MHTNTLPEGLQDAVKRLNAIRSGGLGEGSQSQRSDCPHLLLLIHQTWDKWTQRDQYALLARNTATFNDSITAALLACRQIDTPLTASFPGQPGQAGTRKVKPIWILMKQEMTGWPWHQLDHTQIICTSLQTDNHTSTSSLIFTDQMLFLKPNQQRESSEDI